MRAIRFIVMLLVIIGALNWGAIGFFGYDVIGDLFGGYLSTGARIIFALVGLAGLYAIGMLCHKCCCGCSKRGCNCGCNCKCHNSHKHHE